MFVLMFVELIVCNVSVVLHTAVQAHYGVNSLCSHFDDTVLDLGPDSP